jgi:hypothetical protein
MLGGRARSLPQIPQQEKKCQVLIHDILFFRFSSIKTSIKREKGEDEEEDKEEELNT